MTSSAPPSLYYNATSMYDKMFESAIVENNGAVVYTGFLTELVTKQLNLSIPNFTHCRKILMQMGCIRQIKRGGGSGRSIWELIKAPTEEAFWKVKGENPSERQVRVDGRKARDIQFAALKKRVDNLERILEKVIEEETNEGTRQSKI